MQVTVEKTSDLSRKMTVSLPESAIQEKVEARYKTLAREVKVDGFRPGKAPATVLKKLYGDRVRGEVTGDLIQTTYFKALEQEKLEPAGAPYIQSVNSTDGFQFVAEFEVYPEVSLEGIAQLKVKKPLATVLDSDVEAMIAKLTQQRKTFKEVDRAAQDGDVIIINFSGVSEGENFTNGKAENSRIEIGAGQMIPGFEDELKGLAAGATKTFSITFPEQYHSPNLAGKTAEFEIEVVRVEEPVVPEIDTEFVKSYGVESGDIADFKQDIKANMERELIQGLKNRLKSSVLNALEAAITFPVPKVLVDQEIQALIKPYADRAKSMGQRLEDLQLPTDTLETQAKRRVTLSLILGEVIEKNAITVDADKVRQVVENMAKSYEKPEEVINWYYSDPKNLQEVQQMVLEDQTIEWVVGQSQVTDEIVSFGDVMEMRN